MNTIGHELKILIGEDDEDDYFLAKELIRESILEAKIKMDRVVTLSEVLSHLESDSYDICILDYYLGVHNGLDILKVMREKGFDVPTILLTGQGDQEIAVATMKAGASDYISKNNLSADVLGKAIRHSINLHKEEEQRRRAEKALLFQGQLFQGVSEAVSRLLTVHNHEQSIKESIAIMGNAAQVDRVYIFQDHPHKDTGRAAFSIKHYWAKEGNNEFDPDFKDLCYQRLGIVQWVKDLSMGKTVSGIVDEFPEPAGQFFKSKQIKSMILVPVKMDYIYWGFIGFADCHSLRFWNKDEEHILRTFSACIGGEFKRYQDDQAFRSIVEGTSGQTGDEFFHSLVRNLASALPMRWAVISELLDYTQSTCKVVAGWDGESLIKKYQFDVVNTPHEDILGGMFSFYPDRVQDLFPNDPNLKKYNIQSYAGVPFFNSAMKIIGHLSVYDNRPMVDKERTISILRIFAARAGAELERKRSEETIKNMAYHDPLTGLPNRILLNDRLTVALANSKRNKNMLAVFYLDYDNFKNINDTYGHGIGDLLLQRMSALLKGCLREEDTVARLGGDEFILVFPGIHNKEDVKKLAEKINKLGSQPMHLEGQNVQGSISIGVAIYPEDGMTGKELLSSADDALYTAKREGKNRYHFASPLELLPEIK